MAGINPAMTSDYDERLAANPLDLRPRRGAFDLAGSALWLRPRFARGAAAAVGQNNVTDGGIRRRHGVEAIYLVDFIVERAAHDQPHHHFDAFGAGLAHVIDVRNLYELLRIL